MLSPTLKLQALLRDKGIEAVRQLGIDTTVHPEFTNLVQFTYNQINCYNNRFHPVVVESRGVILDSANDWAVVAYPFNRFFNYTEYPEGEKQFNWNDFQVAEKLDGSLMIMYHYDGNWWVATKGSPDAGGNVGVNEFTFRALFWKVFGDNGYFFKSCNPKFTYMFELTSQFNQIVTNQSGNNGSLTLIGVRNNVTLQELSIDTVANLALVRRYSLNNIEEILHAAKTLSPDSSEGYVLVDNNFNRIKVKSPQYVAVHALVTRANLDHSLIDIIRAGELTEVLTYLPYLHSRLTEIESSIKSFAAELESSFTALPFTEDRKEFALSIESLYANTPWKSFFYARRWKAVSAQEWIMRQKNETIISFIDSKSSASLSLAYKRRAEAARRAVLAELAAYDQELEL